MLFRLFAACHVLLVFVVQGLVVGRLNNIDLKIFDSCTAPCVRVTYTDTRTQCDCIVISCHVRFHQQINHQTFSFDLPRSQSRPERHFASSFNSFPSFGNKSHRLVFSQCDRSVLLATNSRVLPKIVFVATFYLYTDFRCFCFEYNFPFALLFHIYWHSNSVQKLFKPTTI